MGRSSHFTSGSGGSLALVPTGVLAEPVPCDVVGVVQEAPRQTATIATEWARIVCRGVRTIICRPYALVNGGPARCLESGGGWPPVRSTYKLGESLSKLHA